MAGMEHGVGDLRQEMQQTQQVIGEQKAGINEIEEFNEELMGQVLELPHRFKAIDLLESAERGMDNETTSGMPSANVQSGIGNVNEVAGHVQSDPVPNVINLLSGGTPSHHIGVADVYPRTSAHQTTG